MIKTFFKKNLKIKIIAEFKKHIIIINIKNIIIIKLSYK